MKKYTMETAIKKAQEGEFEFHFDARIGLNNVRYQTPSGKWKEKIIEIVERRRRAR